MSLAEHIKNLENTRAAKVARLEEITNKSIEADRSFDQSEVDEFDDIKAEIKQIDEDLVRYNDMLKMQASTAAPVQEPVRKAVGTSVPASAPRALAVITNKEAEEKFEGQNFTRLVIAKTLAKLDDRSRVAIAQERWGKTNPSIVEVMKADVAGHGSGSGEAGAELVHADRWTGDFIEYLYSKTVYDKLNLRVAPANVNIAGQDGGATAYWVGESKAIPATSVDFMSVNLAPLKVAALCVSSKELLRDSSPAAEQLFRDALVNATAQKIDGTFISDAAAAAGVSPAGILNGVTATASAGTDDSGVLADIQALLAKFIEAKNAMGITLLANPATAMAIGLMRNTLDQHTFPGVTHEGGTLNGLPLVTGENVPADVLVAVKATDIYRIEAGGMETSISENATIEMDNAPTADTDTPTAPTGKTVSMFQTESVAIKVVQPLNFAKRRASAVQYISGVNYGGSPASV